MKYWKHDVVHWSAEGGIYFRASSAVWHLMPWYYCRLTECLDFNIDLFNDLEKIKTWAILEVRSVKVCQNISNLTVLPLLWEVTFKVGILLCNKGQEALRMTGRAKHFNLACLATFSGPRSIWYRLLLSRTVYRVGYSEKLFFCVLSSKVR